MSKIAIAGEAGDENNKRDGDFIGTVKEFPEIKIAGTTRIAVLARVKSEVRKAVEKRIIAGEKFSAKKKYKVKATVTVKKKEK